jgi:superfamily II DNA or RNA helicase
VSFYAEKRAHLALVGATKWRVPQTGALASVLAHWTLPDETPALISLPTGTGKTAVALAAPFLLRRAPRRVLVVAPSRHLREQLVNAFKTQASLVALGAFGSAHFVPKVLELSGRPDDWRTLEPYDVVVSLPNSISPAHFAEADRPPRELFDLIIVDEAHHVPASTWTALVQHFVGRKLYLTATPIRRDKKRIPGHLLYHYPLATALQEGLYQPIDPVLLPYDPSAGRDHHDMLIARECRRLLSTEDHQRSTLLVRAKSIERLESLRTAYASAGIDLRLLHNRIPQDEQHTLIEGIRGGGIQAVGVVAMLGEGFDLPSLRLLAYHDKHRSLAPTMQLLGRLARTHPEFPQRSALVTVKDADVFPELKGAVRALYEEDETWADVLPGIIDDEVEVEQRDRTFIEALPPSTSELHIEFVHPLKRCIIYEVDEPPNALTTSTIPPELDVGQRLSGNTIIYAGFHQESGLLVIGLRRVEQPKWTADVSLVNTEYEVALVSLRTNPNPDQPDLVFINCESLGVRNEILKALAIWDSLRVIDPRQISAYLDSLDRISVSSVGMRTTNANNLGRATYRSLMGSGVDRGLRVADTARAALGHVMLQVRTDAGSTTSGAALEKGKLWLTRYDSLRSYNEWITELTDVLGAGTTDGANGLLPGIQRARRLLQWPEVPLLAAELDPQVRGQGFALWDNGELVGPIEDLELFVANDPLGILPEITYPKDEAVRLLGIYNDRRHGTQELVWDASLHVDGRLDARSDLDVGRGMTIAGSLASLLEEAPPTIYFLDGTTTVVPWRYDSRVPADIDYASITALDWDGTDITAETRATASQRGDSLVSLHERLEQFLLSEPTRGTSRWIICNDGPGELADYLVVEELRSGEVALGLWHAKAAGGAPSIRVGDVQVVVAQALRSRQHFTSPLLWMELAARIEGRRSPVGVVVPGSSPTESLLTKINGSDQQRGWATLQPNIQATVGIVQPGLSVTALREANAKDPPSTKAVGIGHLLNTFIATSAADGSLPRVLASP